MDSAAAQAAKFKREEESFLSSFIHHDDGSIKNPEWMPIRKGEHDAYPNWQEELIVREVFTSPDGRVLGTEWTIYRVYQAYNGYKYEVQSTETRHFHRDAQPGFALGSEAGMWRDDLYHARQLARVQGNTTRHWLNRLEEETPARTPGGVTI